MITFLTSCKPFRGRAAVHQANALASWRALDPEVEVLLFGDDEGCAEIARRLDLVHVPDVACNELGTPLLSDIFARGQSLARHSLVCYINADIVLTPDFLDAVRRVAKRFGRFLMIGHRCDLDLDEPLAFEAGWPRRLEQLCREGGRRSHSNAIDYFVFRRGLIVDMPPFAIGRPAWDNWLIWKASAGHFSIVDATSRVLAIHQNHGYEHIKRGTGLAWEGEEANRNRSIAGGGFPAHCFTILNAGWLLNGDTLVPALTPRRIGWRCRSWLTSRGLTGRLRRVRDAIIIGGRAVKGLIRRYLLKRLAHSAAIYDPSREVVVPKGQAIYDPQVFGRYDLASQQVVPKKAENAALANLDLMMATAQRYRSAAPSPIPTDRYTLTLPLLPEGDGVCLDACTNGPRDDVRAAITQRGYVYQAIDLTGDNQAVRREDLTALSFADNSIGAIVSVDTLEHIPDYAKAVAEMYRVLKPDATAVVHVPCYYIERPESAPIAPGVDPFGHVYYLSARQLLETYVRAGFVVQRAHMNLDYGALLCALAKPGEKFAP